MRYRTQIALVLAVTVAALLPASGDEKVEVRTDGVISMTHGENYFKEHFAALKAKTLADMEKVAADLKKQRQTRENMLKRKQLAKMIDHIKKSKDQRSVFRMTPLKNLRTGEVSYIELNGVGNNQDVAVRVIDVVNEDEFTGVMLYAVTPYGIDGKIEESDPLWFRRFTTDKLTDNATVYLTGLYKTGGTKKYTNLLGGTNTVKIIEPWEPEFEPVNGKEED